MGRRRQSAFIGLMELVSLLPWWLGLVLAVMSYLILHQFAIVGASEFNGINNSGNILAKQFGVSLARIFQYIIPIAFVFGSLASGIRQWQKATIYKRQTGINSIRQLTWQQFELLISEAFSRQGYKVRETDVGPDGGIDLILNKNNRTTLVQCKHWKSKKVGVNPVRELLGVVTSQNADAGVFVTSGEYSTAARDFAKKSSIELYDGIDLNAMFSGVTVPSETANNEAIIESPACPRCGSNMVKRTAKQGANAGNDFWGCSRFPGCRGLRNIN